MPVKKKVAKFLCDARNDAENRSLNVRHLELDFLSSDLNSKMFLSCA